MVLQGNVPGGKTVTVGIDSSKVRFSGGFWAQSMDR